MLPFAAAELGLEGPRPTSASWHSFPNRVEVTFDQNLLGASLDTANWTAWDGNQYAVITGASTLGNTVTLFHGTPPPMPPGGWVSYDPPPFDVVSLEGIAAKGFSRFPAP